MYKKEKSRRTFLKKASLAAAAAATFSLPFEANAISNRLRLRLKKGDVILFQGDSITDWGRNKEKTVANTSNAIGEGYPLVATSELLRRHPDLDLKVYNKGISGHKVFQLADRWQSDCLDLQPSVLSVLVGVNDYWHTLTGGYKGTLQTYKDDYQRLLDRTKKALPDVQLIIMEPYAIKGVKAVDESWFPAFDGYREAASVVAKSFDAVFIPLQTIFEKAMNKAPGAYWTVDGVHPSVAGEGLIANAWLSAIS